MSEGTSGDAAHDETVAFGPGTGLPEPLPSTDPPPPPPAPAGTTESTPVGSSTPWPARPSTPAPSSAGPPPGAPGGPGGPIGPIGPPPGGGSSSSNALTIVAVGGVVVLVVVILLMAVVLGFGGDDDQDEVAATDGTTTTEATTTTAAPTTTPPTTTPPTTTPPTTAPPATTAPALPPVTIIVGGDDLAPGQLCRDLLADGVAYDLAVAYWLQEGRPSRMDEDGNGIPCETVYPPEQVEAVWGPQGLEEDGVTPGLFCADLAAQDLDYGAAVAYWFEEGQPARMDDDGNGRPCETVYPAAEVEAYWA